MKQFRFPKLNHPITGYIMLTAVLMMLPLFQVLHVESSGVVAGFGFWFAGLDAIRLFRTPSMGNTFLRVWLRQESYLLIPLFGLTMTLFWAPNCGYWTGLGFFLLFPVVSIFLAVTLAWWITGFSRFRWHKTAFWIIGLTMLLGGVVFDLGFHPQFYTYNHVFGGVLGPIYDEELAIRHGLFWFRGLSVLWAVCFGIWGSLARPSSSRAWLRFGLGSVLLMIGVLYVLRAELGINTTYSTLSERLRGRSDSRHFVVHYDPDQVTKPRILRINRALEFRYEQFRQTLQVGVPHPIHVYLYPNAAVKAELTGARYTNVAPVWLPQPQMHILWPAFDRVMPHELAHVFSREFGLPVIRASFDVGLVEGLAVALEPPRGTPTPEDQVAAILSDPQTASVVGQNLVESIAEKLSPQGFWGGRGAVSYTTMGAFVRFLIGRYGAARFKTAYPRGNFEVAYGKSVQILAQEWVEDLRSRVTSQQTAEYALRQFSEPSLFETRCPHFIPEHERLTDAAAQALENQNEAEVIRLADRALKLRPDWQPAWNLWATGQLSRGNADAVLRRAIPDRLSNWLTLRQRGDAFALKQDTLHARSYWKQALAHLPAYAWMTAGRLTKRSDFLTHPELLKPLLQIKKQNWITTATDVPAWMFVYAADAILEQRNEREDAAVAQWRKAAEAYQHAASDPAINRDFEKTLHLEALRLWIWIQDRSAIQKLIAQEQSKPPASVPLEAVWQDLLSEWKWMSRNAE